MSLTLLPDVAKAVSYFLRQQAEVTALVSDRVWTVIPAGVDAQTSPVFPLVRITRIGGRTTTGDAYWGAADLVTVDAFASTRSGAAALAETCRAALAQRFTGTQVIDGSGSTIVVSATDPGGIRDLSAGDNAPAGQHRSSFDVVVTSHPAP